MPYVKLDNETMPLLSALHGRYKLGIVSNFAIPEAVWLLLDKLNLRSFFKAIVTSGEITGENPAERFLKEPYQFSTSKPQKQSLLETPSPLT